MFEYCSKYYFLILVFFVFLILQVNLTIIADFMIFLIKFKVISAEDELFGTGSYAAVYDTKGDDKLYLLHVLNQVFVNATFL